ncbi:MAG TPA: sensor histidine kinase [Candidatus Limnocylindria bacterium]|nr:sensor histidine kinase [Candidatus Limnocylindria bacterium]
MQRHPLAAAGSGLFARAFPGNPFSIRSSLYVLLLVALVPLMGVEVYNSVSARRESAQALEQQARNESSRLAGELGRLLGNAEYMLRALARSAAVQTRDGARCSEYVSGLQAVMNGPAGIGVADRTGHVFCLSRDLPEPINIADRRYFNDAVVRRSFSVGEYVVGRRGGVPAIHFGLPVFAGDQVSGVAFVPVNLEWLSKELASKPLPKGGLIRLVDANGVVVAAYPRASEIGQRLDLLAPSGDAIMVATSPVEQSDQRLSIWVGLPTEDAVRRSNDASFRAAAWLLASVLSGLVLASLISRELVHRPLRQLQRVAEDLKAGDFDARPDMPHRVKEFASLAHSFEELAQELQSRRCADLELQEQLKHARDEALAASAYKSTFLSSVSHDLRQPLQALTYTTGLLGANVRDPLLVPLVQRLGRSAESLTDLVNALLEVSQLDAGLIRPRVCAFPVSSLWQRSTEDFLDMAAAKQVKIVAEPCEELICSDPRLLARMVQNAVSNALKYTPAGGTVTLRATRVDDDLELAIGDNGPGIPVGSQAEVWEEFRQLDNPERDPAKGLGLGMAIIRRIGDLLSHKVWLESHVGAGTTVRIRVERARSSL